MILGRLNLGIASEDQEDIDLYNHFQKYLFPEKKRIEINLSLMIFDAERKK